MDIESDIPLTVELHQKVIRADGTVEDLGCVASTEGGTVQVHDERGLLAHLKRAVGRGKEA